MTREGEEKKMQMWASSHCWSDGFWTRNNNVDSVPDLANVVRTESWIHHFPEVLPFFKVWGTKNVVVRLTLQYARMSGFARRAWQLFSFLVWCIHVANTVEEERVLDSAACT